MINITNIGIKQMLLASALFMAASGGASAQTNQATMIRVFVGGQMVPFPLPHELITQTELPYFASPQAVNSKPLGQFAFNTHICSTGRTYNWNGIFFQYVLPSGELVYTPKGIDPLHPVFFRSDTAGGKSCMSQVASTTLPDNISSTVQTPPTKAASGPTYYASTANDEKFASVYNFAAIVRAPVSYYPNNVPVTLLDTTPPLGQFVANQHVCVGSVLKWGSKDFALITLPGTGIVNAVYSTETFIPDPPNNQGCEEAAAQYNLEHTQLAADERKRQRELAAEKEEMDAKEAADKIAKEAKPLLAKRKEIGDTVCYPSSCTGSSCVVYGQVENVHNDKIEVRVHVHESGSIGIYPFAGTPGRDYDKLEWVNYNAVVECTK